ncbi:MAG TPA: radical SAM protein [Thermoanaerobaculia bacterium]|nr:radical SAM protein [Thermoanaerobaculia bacterium]
MANSLDVLLINPGSRTQVYQSLGNELAAVEPPVWAGMMASFVRGKGKSVGILDAEAERLTPAQVAERVAEIKPLLAAIVVYGHQPSASTQNMPAAGAIAAAIKQRDPEQPTMLVGGHVASLPQRTLAEESVDYIATGEGLHTMVDLVEALSSSNPRLDQVRGLGYRDAEGAIRITASAPLLMHLETEMPGLAWDLLPMERYRAHNWHCFGHLEREPYAAIYTTLGCPYHCTFCCIQAPFRTGEKSSASGKPVNSYRMWSAKAVLEQIETLVTKYGVRNIKVADEMFVLNPRHVESICDGIIERGYDLNIWAYARVDTVQDRMLDKLRRAGFRWLAFGIESADETVRDDVDKGFEQSEIFDTLEKVRNAGIYVIGNYIFGLPEDSMESMEKTLQLAIELNCEFANFYSTMAYPGSPLYATAVERGWPLPKSWSGFSQHSVDASPLPTKHVTAAEVLRFRDAAFDRYFANPEYLALIDRVFGPATVEHIRGMASHSLVRTFTPEAETLLLT